MSLVGEFKYCWKEFYGLFDLIRTLRFSYLTFPGEEFAIFFVEQSDVIKSGKEGDGKGKGWIYWEFRVKDVLVNTIYMLTSNKDHFHCKLQQEGANNNYKLFNQNSLESRKLSKNFNMIAYPFLEIVTLKNIQTS